MVKNLVFRRKKEGLGMKNFWFSVYYMAKRLKTFIVLQFTDARKCDLVGHVLKVTVASTSLSSGLFPCGRIQEQE